MRRVRQDRWLIDGGAGRPASSDTCAGWVIIGLLAAAAALYGFRLGSVSLGASEAYSVAAATQPGLRQVVAATLADDPGKPPLYHLALHGLVNRWGATESVVRALSMGAALLSVVLVYLLSRAMFDCPVALAAAFLWGFNPLTLILAQWARMYTLFAALAVALLALFWKARIAPRPIWLAGLALSTAAILYVHMGGVLYVGAAALLCARDLRQRRSGAPRVAAALMVGTLLFAPFATLELRQALMLWDGHWLDWAGTASATTPMSHIGAAMIAGGAAAVVLLAPLPRRGRGDPLRLCLAWWLLPSAALVAISLAARPVLSPRYFAPALPAAAIIAGWLAMCLTRTLRQALLGATIGLFAVCFVIYQQQRRDTWHQVASLVATQANREPVFFERGFVVRSDPQQAAASDAFPAGYYRLPFDLYYHGAAPRLTIDAAYPARVRDLIACHALRSGGAWLISGKPPQLAALELPAGAGWRVEALYHESWLSVYHVRPALVHDGADAGPACAPAIAAAQHPAQIRNGYGPAASN